MSSKNASFVVKCHCAPIFKLCHHHQQDLNLTKVIQFLQANNNKKKNSNSNNDSSSRILSLYYKNGWYIPASIGCTTFFIDYQTLIQTNGKCIVIEPTSAKDVKRHRKALGFHYKSHRSPPCRRTL